LLIAYGYAREPRETETETNQQEVLR